MVKIGFLKLGNIASAPLIEFLLDERAEREDIDIRVIGTGAKLSSEQSIEAAKKLLDFSPEAIIITSPNASLPGPTKAREVFLQAKIPTIVVSDLPAKKIVKEIEEKGFGYIIVEADSMLGARREFLDPIEMAIFNTDLIKVLAITGAFNIIYEAIDCLIDSLKKGEEPRLPKIIIDRDSAINAAKFSNPYAASKAAAAWEIAKKVSDITVEACFKMKEWEKYTSLCSSAHEMIREASKLADEAREIEKYSDSVIRKPHANDGKILEKRKLIEKPK